MDKEGRLGRLTLAKIVATLGPASCTRQVLEDMVKAGLDVARLNFSHGEQEDHRKLFEMLRDISAATDHQLAIMCDIQGPKIRVGVMESPFVLAPGDRVRLTAQKIVGTKDRFQIVYPGDLVGDLPIGSEIFINDGIVKLIVESYENGELKCIVDQGGSVSSKKGCNLPQAKSSGLLPTPKDVADLQFIATLKPDWIAVSFVGNAVDLHAVRNVLKDAGFPNARLISKIERPVALDNLEEIVSASDAVMVARGDLGVEIPAQMVPVWQRKIIEACSRKAKPCIVATQMLESMANGASRPTRAEVSDVFEAVFMGADATMLSGETSVGPHPVQAVQIMDRIAAEAEKYVNGDSNKHVAVLEERPLYATVAPACIQIVRSLQASKQQCVILTISEGPSVPMWLAAMRLNVHIFAYSNKEDTVRALSVCWGVRGVLFKRDSAPQLKRRGSVDLMGAVGGAEQNCFRAIKHAHHRGWLQESDVALVVHSSIMLGHDGGISLSTYHVKVVLDAIE